MATKETTVPMNEWAWEVVVRADDGEVVLRQPFQSACDADDWARAAVRGRSALSATVRPVTPDPVSAKVFIGAPAVSTTPAATPKDGGGR